MCERQNRLSLQEHVHGQLEETGQLELHVFSKVGAVLTDFLKKHYENICDFFFATAG